MSPKAIGRQESRQPTELWSAVTNNPIKHVFGAMIVLVHISRRETIAVPEVAHCACSVCTVVTRVDTVLMKPAQVGQDLLQMRDVSVIVSFIESGIGYGC